MLKKNIYFVSAFMFSFLNIMTTTWAGESNPNTATSVNVPLAVSWEGAYFGLTTGASYSSGDFVNSGPGAYSLNASFPENHLNSAGIGTIEGLEVGYNMQFGHWVAGFETDYGLSNAAGTTSFNGGFIDNGIVGRSKLRSLGTSRLRFGFAFDDILIYATGGLAYGQVSSQYFDIDHNWYDHTTQRLGGAAGFGAEYALNNKWSVKTEGLYYSLGRNIGYAQDKTTNCEDIINNNPIPCGPYSDKAHGMITRFGLNYRFDTAPAHMSVVAMPASSVSWTGAYIGSSVGAVAHAGTFMNETAADTIYSTLDSFDKFRTTGTGLLAGLTGGYNYQIYALVLGIEADSSLSHAKGTSSVFDQNISLAMEVQSVLTQLYTLRARIGYSFGRTLLYTTGGLAYGEISSNKSEGYPSVGYSHTTIHPGWSVGAGIEYALNNQWTLKTEGLSYRLSNKIGYANDGSSSCTNFSNGGTATSCGPYGDKASGLLVRTGINYKF